MFQHLSQIVLVLSCVSIFSGCEKTPVDTPIVEKTPLPKGKYRVRFGDSLSIIAGREYDADGWWFTLLNANPEICFRPRFVLSPGEIINVPTKEDVDHSLPKSIFPKKFPAKYVVLPGDSLHFMALKCYGDRGLWKAIYDANKDSLSETVLENTSQLTAGDVLVIPKKPQ